MSIASETRKVTDLFYVTYVMDTEDEAVSLSEYLNAHGVGSCVSSTTEVTISLTNPSKMHNIYQLRKNWNSYWNNHMSALFDLPVYRKV